LSVKSRGNPKSSGSSTSGLGPSRRPGSLLWPTSSTAGGSTLVSVSDIAYSRITRIFQYLLQAAYVEVQLVSRVSVKGPCERGFGGIFFVPTRLRIRLRLRLRLRLENKVSGVGVVWRSRFSCDGFEGFVPCSQRILCSGSWRIRLWVINATWGCAGMPFLEDRTMISSLFLTSALLLDRSEDSAHRCTQARDSGAKLLLEECC
jgi:hypothetical protein